MWGSNVPLTRTPDAHFMTEVRYKGTKVVSVAPDYAESVTHADDWIAANPGTDAAVAQAMTHVILDEFYEQRKEKTFIDYAKQYTDMPFLILLEEHEYTYKAGRFLRASDLGMEAEHAEWKPVIIDQNSDEMIIPNGTMGQRWEEDSKWNLILENEDGSFIDPQMTVLDHGSKWEEIIFPFFDDAGNGTFTRSIPVKDIECADGETRKIATVYDVMLSQYGVMRPGARHTATGYDDADSMYTPAWQQKITSVKPELVIQIAREFAQNALDTGGRSMIIMGAGINHWFNSDTIYRSILNLVTLTASQGVNGGGWAHYVGQEKVRPIEGWNSIAFARDWQAPPRLQNATSFFYFATNQWRYEEAGTDTLRSPLGGKSRYQHPADYNVLAARLGWLPSYPQFNKNSLAFAEQVASAGDTSDEAIIAQAVGELKSGKTKFAIEDPDAPENFPRTLFVWRSNIVSSSAKGQEYFMKHLFGATSNLLANPNEEMKPEEIEWREDVEGKLDLLVALDFRMTTTPIYADIVLPAATWYEKEDLSSTDMHPFVHPFNRAVDPLWQARSDWDIYRSIAEEFSNMAKTHLPGVYKDLVTVPLAHDTPQEIAQPFGKVKDWSKGEVEAIPGKTMPAMQIVERDFTQIYDKYVSLGPNLENGKIGAHGVSFPVKEEYEMLKSINGAYYDDTVKNGLPKIYTAKEAAEATLTLSSATNGKVSQRAFEVQEEITGVELKDISADRAGERFTFQSITVQPREVIPTPVFSGSNKSGNRYSPFTTNIERLVPFRTLTGRQHFYLDHEIFQDYGEALPVYKPTLPPMVFGPRDKQVRGGQDTLVLRYLTPHGKWNIHTTYQDNQHMLTLFRGGPTVWMSDVDAKEHHIDDNDWVEVYNRNGVVAARAVVSHRMPKGTMFMYHAQDKHVHVPASELTDARAGSHNAPTKIHMKPTQMVGGYAQLSYGFNYYGPIGNQRDEYVAVRKKKEVNWLEN
jgi:nitrate reductase alpha subunit